MLTMSCNRLTSAVMTAELTVRHALGSAMLALTERQRKFVLYLLETGSDNASAAARAAGYGGNDSSIRVTGWRIAHNPKVQAAIREEGLRRMGASVLAVTSHLVDIATGRETRATVGERLKAMSMVLNRVGLHEMSEHKVSVEHTVDDASMIKRITHLATKLGIDPQKLLGQVTPIEIPAEEIEDVSDE